jgi:hypothetical protein
MDGMQPIGPTRHYVIVCHDGGRIDVDAESMWPAGSAQVSVDPRVMRRFVRR